MPVGPDGPLTVEQLLKLGFDALVFAHGAQGTKYLGVEGERLPGVYHAKDLVYHYNRLPPFAERDFPIGRRVAIVGVGNVMVDVAFDRGLYRQEIERIRPRLEAAGQNPDDLLTALGGKPELAEPPTRARLRFRFLASPKRVIAESARVV